jgi:2-octaprenyl-6-methoxyphenol hydroxylase
MAAEIDCDIAVVGAGPAGLAASLALAEVGARVILIGPPAALPAATTDTRTAALLQTSIDLLKALDIFPALLGHAAPLKGIRILDAGDRMFRAPEVAFQASELGLANFGYNIPNAVLVEVLAAAARRRLIAVEAAAASSIERKPNHLDVVCGNGKTVRARLVVGADGRHSLCRAAAGIEIEERAYEQGAIATSFGHSLPHAFVSSEFHGATYTLTTVPLPEECASSLIWIAPAAEIARLMQQDAAGFRLMLEARLYGLLGPVTHVGARASFPLLSATACSLTAPRIALAGEAAHILPPIGAQGLNLGFRDAAALADCVAETFARNGDPGAPRVLHAYAEARRLDVATRSVVVDLLSRSLLTDLLPIHAARSLFLRGLRHIGPLRRLVMRAGLGPPTELQSLMRPRTSARPVGPAR